MLTARFVSQLNEGVPDWVHLVPAGVNRAVDGRGPFTLSDPAAVIAASMTAGARLPVDENHSTDVAAAEGRPSPARGWIVAMEARADGIWGRVEWTDAGTQLLADRAYRAISPVIVHDKGGAILRVQSAALTNNPGFTQLTTLFTRETDMDFQQLLRAALGLADAADEAAILAAATSAHQAGEAASARFAAIATAAGLDAAAPSERVVSALTALRAGETEISRLTATIAEQERRLTALTAERAREQAVAFIDGAIRAGKPIRALRGHYIDRFVADRVAVETEVNAMLSVNGDRVTPAPDPANPDPAAALTEIDRFVARAFGNDPAKLLALRKERGATIDERAA